MNNETITRLTLGEREYVLIGTAHVSAESVNDVTEAIGELKPDFVGIELDSERFNAMEQPDRFQNLDIFKIIKEGKVMLLLSNLMLSSFQKRIGAETGVKPGEEMRAAIAKCRELNIDFGMIDRNIQITLRRAWQKTGFWRKSKLLAALLSSAFTTEKIDSDEIENMKKKSALEGMMEELGTEMPTIKQTLIDERDEYMATKLFDHEITAREGAGVKGGVVVAVLGAGHVPGIVRRLNELHQKTYTPRIEELNSLKKPSFMSHVWKWLIPAAIVAIIVLGFVFGGAQKGFDKLLYWVILNGGGAALGSLLALGHPLTILAGFFGAPIATLSPVLGVGMITGLVEAFIRKPHIKDLENLSESMNSIKGAYKNRVTRVLLVFILSSLGAIAGNIFAFVKLPTL